jgi:hypothetical protein
MKNMDYVQGVDYGQVLKVRKQIMSRNKPSTGTNINGINWFNKN